MSRRAEALLRALVGVHEAEVSFRPGGAVYVRVAAAGQSSGLLIRNIRSALLAGLGVAVEPPQIELVDPGAWVAVNAGEVVSAAAAIDECEPVSAPVVTAANGHGTGGNGQGASNGTNGNGANGGNGHGHASADLRRGERARTTALRPDPLLRAPLPERTPRSTGARNGEAQSTRVERVELVRHAGRVRCRVVIGAGEERYSAIADAGDDPGAEIQLAGRVACDALRAGGLTSAQFESATVAYLGGRIHVVVALADWRNGEPQPRSGSVVAGESLEHAAARAVLQAALAEPSE
jgi:hypothetical protein